MQQSPPPPEPPAAQVDLNSGRDELNLAEFPLAALSSRLPPELKTLRFEDRIRDQSNGEFITRRLTITAADRYGLPTAIDDDVIVGLIQLTRAHNGFTDRTVYFSRYSLVDLLGWPDSGQSYRRIEQSLKRWLGVTLSYEKAWWDKENQSWVDEHFHILDNVTLVNLETRRRRPIAGRQGELPLASFSWNSVVFRSFQAENLKRLDLNLYFRLTLAPARRALRFLDKRFYRRNRLEFDLRQFACEKVGLSKNYDIGKIKEKLQPSIEELERAEFIEPLSRDQRYDQVGPGVWKVIFTKTTSLPAQNGTTSDEEKALLSRGVTPATARELTARYPLPFIGSKVEIFDWLTENDDERVSKNPAGYLVQSIRTNYGAPKGFETKAEREERRRAQTARREASRAEKTRRAAKLERAFDKDPFLRYWKALSATDQENLRERAVSEAEPWLVERYEAQRERKPHLAKDWLKVIIDRYIEKHGLANTENAPAALKP